MHTQSTYSDSHHVTTQTPSTRDHFENAGERISRQLEDGAMLERLSGAAVRLFSAVLSTSTVGDNAAPRTTNASSSTARRSFALRASAAATAGTSLSTSQTGVSSGLQAETELQPWIYRRASDSELEAVKRTSREQRELKARRASEVWKKFWT